MLDRDALAFLADQAKKAATVQTVYETREKLGYYLPADNTLHEIDKDPVTLSLYARTLASFVDACNAYPPEDARIVVGQHCIFCHNIGDSQGTASIALELRPSDVWRELVELDTSEHPGFDPRQAVKMLKRTFRAANVDSLIDALARVDFERIAGARYSTQHGNESMGRDVEGKVQGIERIAEQFTVHTPRFATEGCRTVVTVECGLYMDTQAQRVHLFPLPDQMRAAEDLAIETIRGQLNVSVPNIPAFAGAHQPASWSRVSE